MENIEKPENIEVSKWKRLFVSLLCDLSITEDTNEVFKDIAYHTRQAGLLSADEIARCYTREQLGKALDKRYKDGFFESTE